MSSFAWLSRARPLLAAASLAGVITACEEQLVSGLACPALCPRQSEQLRDTTLFAVDFDTSVTGFPAIGNENQLILVSQPGTFDARAIVRFDTLQTTFRHKGTVADSALVAIDSAFIKLRVAKSDTLGAAITIEVYDVDADSAGSAVDDTTVATLLPRFSPARLLGVRTFAAASLKDSLAIPIDPLRLFDKIRTPSIGRLRIGVRALGAVPVELSVHSTNGGFPPILRIRPSADTTVEDIRIAALSKTPSDASVAAELADFQIVAVSPPSAPPNIIRVGGAPARRGYLRFNIPTEILDSSSVVRATLELTQRPNPAAPSASDTAGIRPFELAAGAAVTDVRRALVFLAFAMDSTATAPRDSGARSFEMIAALRRWRASRATSA